MKLSALGVEFIKKVEGISLKPYVDDYSGTSKIEYSIGYGHQIKTGEEYLMNGISSLTAEKLLVQDLVIFADTVTKAVKAPLTQNQFDALVSFTFNVGGGNFLSSTLLKKVNSGSPTPEVEAEFRKWVYGTVKGVKQKLASLEYRRGLETDLYTGRYQKKKS